MQSPICALLPVGFRFISTGVHPAGIRIIIGRFEQQFKQRDESILNREVHDLPNGGNEALSKPARLPGDLAPGTYAVVVEATGEYGQPLSGRLALEVTG